MAFSTSELLTLCFDQTTPSGEGGDKIQALYNSMAFNASLAPIQRSMSQLKESNRLIYSILMYLNTSDYTDKDRDTILEYMRFYFWLNIDQKGVHEDTQTKVNELIPLILIYVKNANGDTNLTKAFIAKTANLELSWYKKGRKIDWDKSFNNQVNELISLESQGFMYLEPAVSEVHEAFAIPDRELSDQLKLH